MHERRMATTLDGTDPLRAFHQRFIVAPDELIYLDGNSLGRLPRDTAARVADVIWREWGERLIRGWSEGWMELPPGRGRRLHHGLLLQAGGRGARRPAGPPGDRHRPQ
jgi:kynureninase